MLCLFFAVFSFSSADEPVPLIRAPTPVLASSFRTGVDVEAPSADFVPAGGFVDVEREREEIPEIEAGRLFDKELILCEVGRASGVGVPATEILPRAAEGGGPIDPSTRFAVEGVAGLEVEPIDDVESMVLIRLDFTNGVGVFPLLIDGVDDVDRLRSSFPLPPSEITDGGREETTGVAAKMVESLR